MDCEELMRIGRTSSSSNLFHPILLLSFLFHDPTKVPFYMTMNYELHHFQLVFKQKMFKSVLPRGRFCFETFGTFESLAQTGLHFVNLATFKLILTHHAQLLLLISPTKFWEKGEKLFSLHFISLFSFLNRWILC